MSSMPSVPEGAVVMGLPSNTVADYPTAEQTWNATKELISRIRGGGLSGNIPEAAALGWTVQGGLQATVIGRPVTVALATAPEGDTPPPPMAAREVELDSTEGADMLEEVSASFEKAAICERHGGDVALVGAALPVIPSILLNAVLSMLMKYLRDFIDNRVNVAA